MNLFQFFLLNVGAAMTALGGVFLKRLSSSFGESQLDLKFATQIFLNPNLWLGGICYVLPILFWAYLLRSMELTKLQPILSIVYIYAVGFAYFLLDEQPSFQRILGIIIVMIGVIIVGRT
jgi:drug/metabolite transporter (DMT)-like permease